MVGELEGVFVHDDEHGDANAKFEKRQVLVYAERDSVVFGTTRLLTRYSYSNGIEQKAFLYPNPVSHGSVELKWAGIIEIQS